MDRIEYFRLFHEISDGDFNLFNSFLKSKTFRKGEFLIVPGQIQECLYLVKNGIQMSYYDSENKSHVIAFTHAPDFCAIPDSFSFQKPSACYLQCISDSEMDFISYSDLQELFNQSQQIERLFRKLTEALLSGVINRHMELHRFTMEERYLAFCKRSPGLLQMVPHKYIASYLNIDPTNFSKLFNSVRF